MSRASDARRQRRAMKAAGVVMMESVALEQSALAAAVTKGANLVDLVAYHIGYTLEQLDTKGADVIGGHTVVTIGEHPDHPGALTIETKAAKLKDGARLVDEGDLSEPIDGADDD